MISTLQWISNFLRVMCTKSVMPLTLVCVSIFLCYSRSVGGCNVSFLLNSCSFEACILDNDHVNYDMIIHLELFSILMKPWHHTAWCWSQHHGNINCETHVFVLSLNSRGWNFPCLIRVENLPWSRSVEEFLQWVCIHWLKLSIRIFNAFLGTWFMLYFRFAEIWRPMHWC